MKLKIVLPILAAATLSVCALATESEEKEIDAALENIDLTIAPLTVDQGPGGSCEYREVDRYSCQYVAGNKICKKTGTIYICD